ncbi:MAG TPA: DUF4388 domain-containing protein, partial [bacterium]|nr:DUF4388 domain-containing protein [bacterium]
MQVDLKKGDLSATPVTHVIRTIVDQQATGRMEFTLGEEWKVVFFRDGNIISAKSSSPDEQLLELMDRGGVIDHSNLERVRVLINESGWRTPQVEQLIDAGTQKWWMRTLVREVFLSLLEWTDAVFKFVPKISPPDSLVQVEMETMKLLTSILRRIQDTDILADLLGGYETVLQINTSGFSSDAARSMTSQDGFFLSRIDGKLDLRSILTMGGAQKLDMLRSYINASMNGLIEPVRVTEPETEAVSEEVVEESEEPVAEEPPAAEDDGDAADDPRLMFDDSDDIMLTTDELMNLRKLQGRLDSDFLDLSKELNLDKKQEEESVGYDSKVMYLRGGEYVESDGSDGSYDVDQLGRITTHEDWAS